MCGIFGGHPSLLMADAEELLRHRGPDQQGHRQFIDRRGEPFQFGMTRLSIVSRKDMEVPLSVDGACIAFNGEIYNWRELRKTLEDAGVQFATDTDTELVLQAYLTWGPGCLDRFNGMFAIAIWHDGELFLARDRFGEKPLFFTTSGESMAYASEIKSFSALEYREIEICQTMEFYFDEHTPYRNVYSIKPGEYLLYDTGTRRAQYVKWWDYPAYEGTISDIKVALADFIPLLEDSCKLRMVADVPVTIFLSGGIDSSLIQAILKFDTSFTVQFSEFKDFIDEESLVLEYGEFLGFDPIILKPGREEFLESLPDIARHIEFPVGSFSVFPLFCLSRAARDAGFKVALAGDAADELFNGYYRNEMLLAEDELVDQFFEGPYRPLASRYFGTRLERESRMASRDGINDAKELAELFKPLWRDDAPFAHNLSVIETKLFLQAPLVMADRMSMAHGLEIRNPYLDFRLVDYLAKLSPNLRYHDGHGKFILREALKELVGTDQLGIIQRKYKHGLPSPVNNWLFKRNDFDRKNWNNVLLGECLKQLRQRHE